jgi:hypothetical protein
MDHPPVSDKDRGGNNSIQPKLPLLSALQAPASLSLLPPPPESNFQDLNLSSSRERYLEAKYPDSNPFVGSSSSVPPSFHSTPTHTTADELPFQFAGDFHSPVKVKQMLGAKSNPQSGVPIKGRRGEYVLDFPKDLWAPSRDQTVSHVLPPLKLKATEFTEICQAICTDTTLRNKKGKWCMINNEDKETNCFKHFATLQTLIVKKAEACIPRLKSLGRKSGADEANVVFLSNGDQRQQDMSGGIYDSRYDRGIVLAERLEAFPARAKMVDVRCYMRRDAFKTTSKNPEETWDVRPNQVLSPSSHTHTLSHRMLSK